MFDALKSFFDSSEFMPHGHCFLWETGILWLHVVSDLLIAAAYYSLPVALIYFARKRPDMPFRHMFVMFGAFIMLCGTTHLMGVWVLWYPDYGPEGIVKALTAAVSFITAIIAWKIMPQLLTLPSPHQMQLLNEQLVINNREIEEKVRERTAALEEANRKLEESYAEADKANRAKSDFLANMSHEIRTPMNAVVGLTHLLGVPGTPPERQQEFLRTLHASADSLLALINDLLDMSKIESEYVKLDNTAFNLRQLAEEAVSVLRVQAESKHIALSFTYADDMGDHFIGDPTRIRQILMNLLSNAVKFTEKGEVILRISAQHNPVTRLADACIEVIDTGIGVPPEKREMIFSKFSQADTSITRKYGGTGLGLAITKALIELMGGTIKLESEVGKGSRFSVVLPLARPAQVEELRAARRGLAPADQRQAFNAKHLLLVEDYQPNILVATALLDQLGYSCDVAQNGEEAITRFFAGNYALVLMDVQMPLLDGYRATRMIREEEEKRGLKRTPIIGITAYALSGDKQKCLMAGMDDYLAKPFSAEELKAKIDKLI